MPETTFMIKASLAGYNSTGKTRSEIISPELEEINKLTTKVLSEKIKSGDLSHFLKPSPWGDQRH